MTIEMDSVPSSSPDTSDTASSPVLPMGRLLSLPTAESYPFPSQRRTLLVAFAQQEAEPPRVSTSDTLDNSALTQEEEKDTLPTTSLPLPLENDASALPVDEQLPTDKDSLRAYMITHSLKGNKMSKARQPFVGEVVALVSPVDADVSFNVKRLNNRAVMAYRDKNSQVRYIMDDGQEKYVTEKDYPVGTMRKDTVFLGLDGWNITDPAGNSLPITEDTILSYLEPEELDAIYDKVLEVNPILTGSAAAAKND